MIARKATALLHCFFFFSPFCNQEHHQQESLLVFSLSFEPLVPKNRSPAPQKSSTSSSSRRNKQQRIAIVGGGISGLTIAHVLQQQQQSSTTGRQYYQVQVLEAKPNVGGHVRSIEDPTLVLEQEEQAVVGENQERPSMIQHKSLCWLNIGHATHMGMFINLRRMLQHFGLPEWPVGRGPNHQPGLFRMTSVTTSTGGGGGQSFQPPLQDILSWSSWWQALVFYYDSFRDPTQRLDVYLNQKKKFFSSQFLNILCWAMATFEFDKDRSTNSNEMGEYALGTARAWLVTQVFFQFLLCERFEGRLPGMIDSGLKDDLAQRIVETSRIGDSQAWVQNVSKCFQRMTANVVSDPFFTPS
jgi:NAD(P)-binding Rossmann-like domain